MVKGILSINGIKAGAVALMLAGAGALYASNPVKNDSQPNQTEVVSKEGAEALKAQSVTGLASVNQTSVPTIHNPKLDRNLRKFIESEDDKQYVDNIINNVYKNNGTYLASALMQHEINHQNFYAFLTGNTGVLIKNNINPSLGREIKGFGSKFYVSVADNKNNIINWIDDTYNKLLNNSLRFDHKPTAAEVSTRLDDFVKTKAGFTRDEILDYYGYNDGFITDEIKKKNDTQSMSDLIAYKIFLIDKMIYTKKLRSEGAFKYGCFENGDKNIKNYYMEWMESLKPNGN